MPEIRHALIIGAPAETVYRALTTQEGLSAWWTPDTVVDHEAATARFTFAENYFKEMKIEEPVPDEKVEWLCTKGTEEWLHTRIYFDIKSAERSGLSASNPEMADQLSQLEGNVTTVLSFTHKNWNDYSPMFAECSYTWARFLNSLKLFCETGKGRPWPTQHKIPQ